MKRIISIVIKVAALVSAAVFFVVAFRRIVLDLETFFEHLLSLRSKSKYVPNRYRKQHEQMLEELTKPLEPGGFPLGVREEWKPWMPSSQRTLRLSSSAREKRPLMLVVGAKETGKSSYLAQLVQHDIEANEKAVVVVDPDGELTEHLLRWMSAHRNFDALEKRIFVIDPANSKGTIGFNPLRIQAGSTAQKAAHAVVFAFQSIESEPPGSQSQWNAQSANILKNCALLLIANGKSLIDIPTLLQDNDFRDSLLLTVERRKSESSTDAALCDVWAQFKRLARTDQWLTWVEPILNRLGPALSDPRIRKVLTGVKNDFEFSEVIAQKQIVLINISQRRLDCNGDLLAGLVIGGLMEATMPSPAASKKTSVSLYIDDLDAVKAVKWSYSITSRPAVDYIGVVASICKLHSLPTIYREQLIADAGTIVAFALSAKDAEMLGPQMFRVDSSQFSRTGKPDFDLIEDLEKLGIDRLLHQENQHFYFYMNGTVAGVFQLCSHSLPKLADSRINWPRYERIANNSRLNSLA